MRNTPHVYPTRDTKEDRTSEKKKEVKSVVNALIIEDYTRNDKNIEIVLFPSASPVMDEMTRCWAI